MALTETKRRNYCLDFVKGIACILVVFMHCEFPGTFGVAVQAVSRFCVPFFFMVSGYFCFNPAGKTNYGKKIKHIGVITLCAFLFYAVLAFVFHAGKPVNADSFVKWIAFNNPVYIVGEMWFLFALLYDYIFFAIIDRLNLNKLTLYLIPVLTIAYIVLAQGMFLAGKTVPNEYYRNWLIEGLPFFAAGYRIHRKQDSLRFSNTILIPGFVVCTLLCLAERALLGRDFGVNILTFPQAAFLFLFCVNNAEKGKGRLITRLGTVYSLYVYIFHPAVMNFLEVVYKYLKIESNVFAAYLLPVATVILTIISSVVFLWCLNRAKALIHSRGKKDEIC